MKSHMDNLVFAVRTKRESQVSSKSRWRDIAPALALLLISTGGMFAAVPSPSDNGGQYAVVAPPWYGPERTVELIAKAGGDIVDLGGWANVAVAHSANPGFARALYHAGAWLVVDPGRLRGCLGSERGAASRAGGA
jgi:hypothetical protein